MDRFRELSTFVAVADEGAFNAAARRLNMSPPAVTRFINALEERLDVRLFTRTTRQVALTEAGQRFHADAIRILAELSEAEASATGAHDAPRGDLRLTAPVLFGQRHVAPVLRDYLDRYPSVTARALFVDRIVDLIDEGLDVAVRIGDLPDSSLTATRVAAVRQVTVASPAYVDKAPVLEKPDDLSAHRIVLSMSASAAPTWRFIKDQARHDVPLNPALRVNTMTAAIDAALDGWGVTRAFSYQVCHELQEGRLVEVLAGQDDQRMPIHLMHSEGRRAAAKIRTFVDFAAQVLRGKADQFLALG